MVALHVLYAVARGAGHPFFEALARPSDAPRRGLFVLLPLGATAAGGILSNLLFPATAEVGYLACGWGDAVGEPVGVRWGRHEYAVPSVAGVPAVRSLEGSTAVAVAGGAASGLGLAAAGTPAATAALGAAALGVVTAGVEAISHHGLDNLTLQVAVAGAASLLA